MEQKYAAPVDKVFALLTDPKFIEARCLALGELAARVKAKKAGKGVALSMTRRVKRDLPGLVAKVLPPESDIQFEEAWKPDGDGWAGTLAMTVVGQPVTISAEFSLRPSGKGSVYEIVHVARCAIPLIGGAVAKFSQSQVEQGCEAEFAYTAAQLKKAK